jgi:prolyl oligopeptidase
MLRFQKFSVGYCLSSDYGDSDHKDQFHNLLKYSPLHNIKEPQDEKSQYPAILCKAVDYDDLVGNLTSISIG